MRLIAGKLNNCNLVYYWEYRINLIGYSFKIGDYAIVENMNDYDLVKIVGIVDTTDKYAKFITNRNVNKKVIKIISRETIRGD